MKDYKTANLRNIVMLGHGGEGKTTLSEAMLLAAGAIDRMGGVMDYDSEEQKRGISLSASLAPLEWKDTKINVIDVPGYFDFVGETMGPLRVVEAALIVMNAVSGVSVGAEKAFKYAAKANIARAFIINSMDRENANFQKTYTQLTEKFGANVVPLALPIMKGGQFVGFASLVSGKAFLFKGKKLEECPVPADVQEQIDSLMEPLTEAAAGSDDELMEKFFEEGSLSQEELTRGIRMGIANGMVIPVLPCAALPGLGVAALLDTIVDMFPAPDAFPVKKGVNPKNDQPAERQCSVSAPFSAQVFKTVADPFVGKLSLIRVMSGQLTSDMTLYNANQEKTEKTGNISTMLGRKLTQVDKLIAGDIGALAKLQYTSTSDTLCDSANPIRFPAIDFPVTCISMTVSAKKQGDEDKIVTGLNRLAEEDPSFAVGKSPDTGEVMISGQGELHLDIIAKKLLSKFGVECVLSEPRIPYRETIRKSIKAQGRHKKQTGGHGQFGDCWIEFEPIVDGDVNFEFVDKVVGGSVPRQYIPAVEKGLRENLPKGILAGYPLVHIRASLYDGSFHPVDSSEMAFKTAARLALKKCVDAQPVLLEPIYHVEVLVPDEYMGDIIGDMNRRRGRILGMNPVEEGQQVVVEVPLSEIFRYATDLRSMTQSRGTFTQKFERYEEVPANVAQKIIASAKKDEEEED